MRLIPAVVVGWSLVFAGFWAGPADARTPDRQQAQPSMRTHGAASSPGALRGESVRRGGRSPERFADRGLRRGERSALRAEPAVLRAERRGSRAERYVASGARHAGGRFTGRGGRDGYGRATLGRGGYQMASLQASRGYRGGYESFSGYGSGYISCVPYARSVTGMAISGNGRDWWYNAAGLYDRGSRPEVGSVMAMPGSGGMRMGHVAVVERVIGPREIEIHHANWGGPGIRRGTVMRGVNVVDVSPANDWSSVRIQVGHSDAAFGRPYPVYGFIYNRPDRSGGGMLASYSPRVIDVAEAATPSRQRHARSSREVAQARSHRR